MMISEGRSTVSVCNSFSTSCKAKQLQSQLQLQLLFLLAQFRHYSKRNHNISTTKSSAKHEHPRSCSEFQRLLQHCINTKSLSNTKCVHSRLVRNFDRSFLESQILGNTLINAYLKCQGLHYARRIFDKMPERGVFTWTTIICGYAKNKHTAPEAVKLYKQMRNGGGVEPNDFTFTAVLAACGRAGLLQEGIYVHRELCMLGCEFSVPVANALIDMYAKCSEIHKARQVFDKMLVRDAVSWSSIIGGYAKNGSPDQALHLFGRMLQAGIRPSDSTIVAAITACTEGVQLEMGQKILKTMEAFGLKMNAHVASAAIDLYGKTDNLQKARQMFEKAGEKNVVAWTAMIRVYVSHGLLHEAFRLFEEMQKSGIQPNHFTCTTLLSACTDPNHLQQGLRIHDYINKHRLNKDVFLMTALVGMYAKCGTMDMAIKVSESMPEKSIASWNTIIAGYVRQGLIAEAVQCFRNLSQKDAFAWTTVISGLAQCGRIHEAYALFQEMPSRDVVSWNAMVAGFAQNGRLDKALQLFMEMPERDDFSWTAMTSAYAQNGIMDEAVKLFNEMPRQTIASGNAIIAGYAQNGESEKALQMFWAMPSKDISSWNFIIAGLAGNGVSRGALSLFREMQKTDIEPNCRTFASVLASCADLAALKTGTEIHEKVGKSGISEIVTQNSLINMYAKCGALDEAEKVFVRMPERDAVSWTVMISGFGIHGNAKMALQLLEQMVDLGFSPNDIVFLHAMSACSHAGLVEEGYQLFESMVNRYRIAPKAEHYSCVVDLLGRAGNLEEALKFIEKREGNTDANVWRAFLSACVKHRNTELAEFATERLVQLDNKTVLA